MSAAGRSGRGVGGAPVAAPTASLNTRSGPVIGHAFLQAIMQRGYMLEDDAKKLYKRICNVDTGALPA